MVDFGYLCSQQSVSKISPTLRPFQRPKHLIPYMVIVRKYCSEMIRLRFCQKISIVTLFFVLFCINIYTQRTPAKIKTDRESLTSKRNISEALKLFEEKKCVRQEKIYFLKTSKTGSTTIANILIRLGLKANETNFLFGENGNGGLFFTYSYMPFKAETCFLGSFGIKI